MKAYWKNHPALRMVLMLVLFVLALVLVVSGWKMTGQLAGLGIMLVGVALLLAVLALYNATYDKAKNIAKAKSGQAACCPGFTFARKTAPRYALL